jgi:hypothetical protein
LSLERLRRLPGGRVSYRLKYVDRGRRGKHRVMTGLEFMARLAALIAPPRYPLTRFAGVLAPRSKWRREVVPKPRERRDACDASCNDKPAATAPAKRDAKTGDSSPHRSASSGRADEDGRASTDGVMTISVAAPPPGEVTMLSPNVISVKHWDRLLGGLLYATSPRIDWASLLRRSFQVDVLECPKCHGRLRVVAVITERASLRRILTHLGIPTDSPTVARARDPTDDVVDDQVPTQLTLGLA